MTTETTTHRRLEPFPLPPPDADGHTKREHIQKVADRFACIPYDIAIWTCQGCGDTEPPDGLTCGKEGNPAGRNRYCSEACRAIRAPRPNGNQASALADDGEENEGDDMAKKAGAAKAAKKPKTTKSPSAQRRDAAKADRKRAAAKPPSEPKAPKPSNGKIDPAELKAGMTLVATYKKQEYTAEVDGDGGIVYEGTTYKTLSAAATAVTGGAVNGRAFWRIA